MKKVEIPSMLWLQKYLEQNKSFTFSSKPQKLTHLRILLFALATRDFNPAHIVSDYANQSIFRGVVSHGIGTAARAEAEYQRVINFGEPVELIARGYGKMEYYKPLRLGHTYQYVYKISNLKQTKGRWGFDCHVLCKTLRPGMQVVAEFEWKPAYIQVPQLSLEEKRMLKPKSYIVNVFQYLFFEPIMKAFTIVFGAGMISAGLIIILLQLLGIMPVGTTDMWVAL